MVDLNRLLSTAGLFPEKEKDPNAPLTPEELEELGRMQAVAAVEQAAAPVEAPKPAPRVVEAQPTQTRKLELGPTEVLQDRKLELGPTQVSTVEAPTTKQETPKKEEDPYERAIRRFEESNRRGQLIDAIFSGLGNVLAGSTGMLQAPISYNNYDPQSAKDVLSARLGKLREQEDTNRMMARQEAKKDPSLDDPNSEVSKRAQQSLMSVSGANPEQVKLLSANQIAEILPSLAKNVLDPMAREKLDLDRQYKSDMTDTKRMMAELASQNLDLKKDQFGYRKEEKNQDDKRKLTEKFNKDEVVKGTDLSLTAVNDVYALLNMENPAADNMMPTKFARLSGQAGNSISDRDLKTIGGSKALKDRIAQSIEEAKTGKLSATNRTYLKQVADLLAKTALENKTKRALELSKQNENSDFSRTELIKSYMPSLIEKNDAKIRAVAEKNGITYQEALEAAIKAGKLR